MFLLNKNSIKIYLWDLYSRYSFFSFIIYRKQTLFNLYFQDFPSLNSYWHNEYESRFDANIPSKYDALFKRFMKLVAKNIGKQFKLVENSFSPIITTIDSEDSLFKYLESVHSFFEADNFQGYVLTIKFPLGNSFLRFEVFFKSLQNKNKNKFFVNSEGSSQFSNTAQDLFLDSLMQFKVR